MKTISKRQLLFLISCTVFSPTVRLFSVFSGTDIRQEAMAAPLAAGLIVSVFLLTVLRGLARTGQNYFQTLRTGFGKPLSSVVTVLYLIWGTLLLVLQLRYCSLRMASAAYAHIPAFVFAGIMVLLCIYALRRGMDTVGRISEIALPVLFGVLVLLLILLSRNISPDRLLPQRDALGTLHASLFVLASFGYVTFFLFFADEVTDAGRFASNAIKVMTAAALIGVWLFACVIGTLGPFLTAKLPLPFFSAVRQIAVGEFIQHVDAFVVALWIVSDFILLCVLASSMLKLLEGFSGKSRRKTWCVPYLLLCLALLPLAGQKENDAVRLSVYVFMPANLFFLFVVPLAVRITCAIREKHAARS